MIAIRYSIIIPHYNIPKLLRRCLWSIPHRDDLQIIVVDDRSSDQVVAQLKDIEKDYPYVQFIYSEVNGGAGKARNIGLEYATGDYVLFADPDDYFNFCINDVLDDYKSESCDIVFFNANYVDSETYLPTQRGTTLKSVMLQYNKTKDVSLLKYLFGEPWCKLVKREMITQNRILFDETPIHTDTKFSYLVGFYANDVKVDKRALYTLADRKDSVSKKNDDEAQLVRTRIFAEKNRFLKDHNIPLYDPLLTRSFWFYRDTHDKIGFAKCLEVSAQYGYDKQFITKMILYERISARWRMIKNGLQKIFFGRPQ